MATATPAFSNQTPWSVSHNTEARLSTGFPGGSAVKKPHANAGYTVSIPRLGRSHGEGNGPNSCLGNPMNRGVWWAIVHGVTKSQIDWATKQQNKDSSQAVRFSSVQFSHSAMSDSLRPHELQHARPPCASPIPGVYPNSCPSSRWYHPAISFSVIPFSTSPQSLPASGSFPMSQLFTLGDQSTGVSASASVLPMNT